jgi:hypothetical protein
LNFYLPESYNQDQGIEPKFRADTRGGTMESASHNQFSVAAESAVPAPVISSPAPGRDSVAIRRLMEEVNYEEQLDLSAGYNRMHNRHNR